MHNVPRTAARFSDRLKALCAIFTGATPSGWRGSPAANFRSARSRRRSAFDGGWEALKPARNALDHRIAEWAAALSEDELAGALTWHSGAIGRTLTRPRSELVVHFFNHQTHHRGQVHALLTSFGARPDDTDIAFMTERFAG